MGIDIPAFRLLQYATSKARLGDVATLGRQSIFLTDKLVQETFGLPASKRYGPYCEDLLIEQFGASSVTSFDASDYEKATVVHNMNKPLDHDVQYDTVLDFGTSEHIFDVAITFRNVAKLCKVGGRIMHVLPANNFSGHGFWQFSPELFFSLYSAPNGFAGTEVFIAELNDDAHWWRAAAPENAVRVEYASSRRSYVIASTLKHTTETRQDVQQSDYVANWGGVQAHARPPASPVKASLRALLTRMPLAWRLADVFFPGGDVHRDAWIHELADSNRHFTKLRVDSLMMSGGLPPGAAS